MWPSEEFEMDYGDFEGEFESEFDQFGELEWEGEVPFDQEFEMELAADLLAVSNEAELEQFLGGLIKKVGRAAGSFVRSPVGKALGGVLKSAAKKALPIVGGAIGGHFGGSAGAQAGRKLASGAGRLFGLELEGLSPEDQEFEVARKFVRLASSAVQKAAKAPSTTPPKVVAQKAVTLAARKHAPGLLRGGLIVGGQSGRWIRRGNKIILYGV